MRDAAGAPVVVRNEPFTRRRHADAHPLLAGRSRPEPADLAGSRPRAGCARPQAAVDADALRAAHDAYAAERDAAIAGRPRGPRPSVGSAARAWA